MCPLTKEMVKKQNPLNQKTFETYGPYYSYCKFGENISVKIEVVSRTPNEEKHKEIVKLIEKGTELINVCKTFRRFVDSLPYINSGIQTDTNELYDYLKKTIANAELS